MTNRDLHPNEFERKLSDLDSQVSEIEGATLTLDGQIPMDAFREFLAATPPKNEALASYIVRPDGMKRLAATRRGGKK